MSILVDPSKLRQAAAALYDIDQAGNLRELGDTIQYARKEHKRHMLERSVGTDTYVDSLATAMSRTTGVPFWQCRAAIGDVVSPEWPSVALDEIVAFVREGVNR